VFSISIKSSSYLGSFLLPSVTFSADVEPESNRRPVILALFFVLNEMKHVFLRKESIIVRTEICLLVTHAAVPGELSTLLLSNGY